ncbi:MAG TPA: cytochrome-c oxidase, cbb3-type subunit III [Hyphomicrobiaceae bacterium]|jgi:cytochrome c oxidase cbb3-type subunit 3|nr:cytochrome-c oxidase, cbb3-type subunit III [Hyphomicrobiaceae bacterium]
MSKREVDAVTGIETTGHEWDGIKELNKPLPRWWVWTFYATILWAIGYWIAYPAWPTLAGYTKGILGYSQRSTVASEIASARGSQAAYRDRLAQAPLSQIKSDPDLLRFAMAGGGAAFQSYCAPCHGRGAQGFTGYPNLNDDEWLWGGTIEDIHKTIEVGVRSDHNDTRIAQMPRFGLDKLLDEAKIGDAAEFVLAYSGRSKDAAAAARGAKIFADQCATCHGADGKGKQEQGAPDLTDVVWLYGASRQAIVESIRTGRGGVMPAWGTRLDPVTLKALAVYVHSLGGGK